jgi:predicted enzyme related to lactoylglutathione lyase
MTRGLSEARDFYGPLLGWKFVPGTPRRLRPGSEVIATAHGRPVAGIGLLPPGTTLPPVWTPFLSAADVNGAALAVRQCGGTVGVGPLDDGEGGRLAFCSDPSGALFGVRRLPAAYPPPRTDLPGFAVWLELVVAEARFAAKFYETVFGLERERSLSSAEDPLVMRHAGGPAFGIRGAGLSVHRSSGAHWVTYFATEDVDRAAARAVELGGLITRPPSDGPNGRSVQLTDPDGTLFGLLTPVSTRVPPATAAVPGSGTGLGTG